LRLEEGFCCFGNFNSASVIFFGVHLALMLLWRSKKRTMNFRGTEYKVAAQDENLKKRRIELRGKPDAVLKAKEIYVYLVPC